MIAKWFGHPVRRVIAVAGYVLYLSGCSRAVEVPRGQFDAASRHQDADHRVSTTGGEVFLASKFAMTDSTLVIEKLSPADKGYNHTALPPSFPLAEIDSVHRIDTSPPWWLIGIGAGLFVAVVALVTEGGAFTD